MSNKTVRRPPGQKRFLINFAILLGVCVLLIFRMPTWGIAQVMAN